MDETGLKVSENWMLQRIFGPNRQEVIESYRKLQNEERNICCSSPHIIRLIKLRSHFKDPCIGNIKLDLTETGSGVDSFGSQKRPMEESSEHAHKLSDYLQKEYLLISCATLCLLRRILLYELNYFVQFY
jgi:hypothetical protein